MSKYIYYNMECKNGERIDLDNDPDATMSDSRNMNLLNNAKQYEASIVRFSITSPQSFPLFTPTIELKQDDPNLTIYNMSLAYDCSKKSSATVYTSKKTRAVMFESQFPYLSASTPKTKQDLTNRYYHVMDYNHMVELFNKTLVLVHNDTKLDLETQAGEAINNFPAAPFIMYDSSSRKFSIHMDKTAFGHDDFKFQTANNPVIDDYEFVSKMYFDSNMYGLISNIAHCKEGNDVKNIQGAPKFNYKLKPVDLYGKNTFAYNNVDYLVLNQDYASVSNWNAISGIVFTSSDLGSTSEQNSQLHTFLDGNRVNKSSVSASSKIVTDLELPIFSADAWKQSIFYAPSKYRMMSLSSGAASLRNISISIGLRYSIDAVIRPLKLFNGGSYSLKIMFMKKEEEAKQEEGNNLLRYR